MTKIKTITVMEIITATMILIVIMVTITAIIKTVIMGTVITLGPIPYPRPYTIKGRKYSYFHLLFQVDDPSWRLLHARLDRFPQPRAGSSPNSRV